MPESMKRLLLESFLPVLLVVLGIFMALIYAEYRTIRNADAITVIRIDAALVEHAEDVSESEPETLLLTGQDDDDPKLQEAVRLAAEGQWLEAEAKYREILAERPESRVFNDLGVIHLKKGDTQQALGYLNKAIDTPPIYARSYFNRAVAHARLNANTAALDDYAAFIRNFPNHHEAHYNMGLIHMKLHDYTNAAAAFQRAIGLAGGERKARACVGLGSAFRELGQHRPARAAYESAIRLQPDYLVPRLELAALEDDTPDGRERALSWYGEVFRLKPDYPPAYFAMARRYSAAGETESAVAAYRSAIKFNPEYRNAHYNLGLLLLEQKRYSDARAEFEWIARRDPEHGETHFNLARAAYGEGDHQTALVEYRKAIDVRGGNYPEAYFNQGLVYLALKQYADAESAYRKALKLNDAYPEAWYNLGLIQLKQKQWAQAEQSFHTALQYNPRYANAWFNLGVLATREGKDDAAIYAYRRAIEIRPDYPEARLNLAVRYAKQDRYGEAITEYLTILEQDDSYALAWLNLGLAYQESSAPEKAERALRRALELEPENLKSMKALATSLSAQHKYDDAADVLRHAIGIDAADPRLRVRLARLLHRLGELTDARSEYGKAMRLDPENKQIAREFNSLYGSALN